jgi:hypothetical protein
MGSQIPSPVTGLSSVYILTLRTFYIRKKIKKKKKLCNYFIGGWMDPGDVMEVVEKRIMLAPAGDWNLVVLLVVIYCTHRLIMKPY